MTFGDDSCAATALPNPRHSPYKPARIGGFRRRRRSCLGPFHAVAKPAFGLLFRGDMIMMTIPRPHSLSPMAPRRRALGELARPFEPDEAYPTAGLMSSVHVPVLMREVLRGLDLAPGQAVVDATVGGGGHSRQIITRIRPGGRLLGLDRDPMMIALAAEVISGSDVTLRRAEYADLPSILQELGWPRVDRVLVDLGLSSDQLADVSRSFSFQATGDLDLRFNTSQGRPASEILATYSLDDLERVFRDYGEEPHSRRIAEQIVRHRESAPIRSGAELADIVVRALPGPARLADKHPATRIFQALRIVVNGEMDHLERALHEAFPAAITPGGILVVISFHSLEDRIVKRALRNRDVWEPLTSKPVEPTPAEVRFNPRSRSAKLRLARRK
jgi:16S rRNA (cytosine1402-N4)-methyltransferase